MNEFRFVCISCHVSFGNVPWQWSFCLVPPRAPDAGTSSTLPEGAQIKTLQWAVMWSGKKKQEIRFLLDSWAQN